MRELYIYYSGTILYCGTLVAKKLTILGLTFPPTNRENVWLPASTTILQRDHAVPGNVSQKGSL